MINKKKKKISDRRSTLLSNGRHVGHSPKRTLLQWVHRSSRLTLERLSKLIGVLNNTIDAPPPRRVIVVFELSLFFLRSRIPTECASVLDEKELLKRV
jgi:hypothetical protein